MKILKLTPQAAAFALLLFLFAGCQGIEEQIGKTIAEKAIEGATGGSMQVNTDTGEVKIKTPEGEVKVTGDEDQFVVTTPEGEAVFGGGDTRPAAVADDLPNPEGAADFTWAGSQEGGMFSYTVKGVDQKQACGSEIGLLEGKGWKLNEETLMEFEGMVNRSLSRDGYSLSLSCSADKEENTVTVVMIKSNDAQ